MRKTDLAILAALVMVLGPALAFAGGGGAHSGTSTATTTSTVTLDVPGVVAIDIETDPTIDLGTYVSGGAAGQACDSFFPPAMGCTGAADYLATSGSTTSGVPTPAPAADSIWMAVFCNKTTGTLSAGAYAAAAWAGGTPYTTAVPQHLQFQASGTGNASGFGGTPGWTAFGTSGTQAVVSTGTIGATFVWTRVDQRIRLEVPAASGVTWTVGTYTAVVTYTISKV